MQYYENYYVRRQELLEKLPELLGAVPAAGGPAPAAPAPAEPAAGRATADGAEDSEQGAATATGRLEGLSLDEGVAGSRPTGTPTASQLPQQGPGAFSPRTTLEEVAGDGSAEQAFGRDVRITAQDEPAAAPQRALSDEAANGRALSPVSAQALSSPGLGPLSTLASFRSRETVTACAWGSCQPHACVGKARRSAQGRRALDLLPCRRIACHIFRMQSPEPQNASSAAHSRPLGQLPRTSRDPGP